MREAKPPSLVSGYALPKEKPTVLQDSAVDYGNVQRPKKHITNLMATKKEILRMESAAGWQMDDDSMLLAQQYVREKYIEG